MNTSRSRKIVPITAGAIIALAVVLFLNAMSIGEFAQPGQGLFHGRSNVRLAIAFALLTGLALALLFRLFRTGQAAGEPPVSRTTRQRDSTAAGRAKAPEGTVPHAGTAGGIAAPSEEILSDAAGELRTAVDVIQEELEEILDDDVPADREHMQSLYEETDRLKKIIDSMEELSRVQAIARARRREPLQLEPLLNGVIEVTRSAVPDRDVTYRLECEPGLAMQADPECIRRIIGNIADNAARSIHGSGSVTLTAGRQGGMAVFSVRDTGTGIRRAHLPHIYEHFFRGTGTGIGMGLSIVKELVDACGGTIEVETAVNKGTTFTVRVPAE